MKMLTAKEEEIMGYFWEKVPLFLQGFCRCKKSCIIS